MAPKTILSYLSAIGFVHKMRGLHDPVKAFIIQKLLISISGRQSCDMRLPVSKPILHDFVNSLEHTNSLAAQHIIFSTMFLTAFYGFFHISELAARSMCSSVVQYDNLQLLTSTGKIHSAKIAIHHFKHNTSNLPDDIVITGDDSSPFVPWHPCSSTAKFAGISQVCSFVTQTTAPFQLISLIPNSGTAWLSVVWTLNTIKVTAFALEPPALQQSKVFPMHRFAHLADGNLMLLSSTLGILPCQLSNFL